MAVTTLRARSLHWHRIPPLPSGDAAPGTTPGASKPGAGANGSQPATRRTLRHPEPNRKDDRLTARWRQSVLRTYQHLAMDLIRVGDTADAAQSDEVEAMWLMLDEAYDAATATKATAFSWWSGSGPERAWRCLREVEERLVDVVAEEELDACAAGALDHATFYETAAGRSDVVQLNALRADRSTTKPGNSAAAYRAAIRAVLHSAHARADRRNQDARELRNHLLIASVLTLVGAAALLVFQAHVPSVWIVESPVGWSTSAWILLLEVMVFGAVGALFTAIPALSRVPADLSPFNLPLQQSLLKIVFGSITAVVGLAALGTSPTVNGLTVQVADMTMPVLFLLAVAFGAGQQAVTRYVDRRATAILEEGDTTTSSIAR